MLRIVNNISLNIVRNYCRPLKALEDQINRNNINPKYATALEKFEGKILFNSVLEVQNVRIKKLDVLRSKHAKRQLAQGDIKTLPLVLNQLCEAGPTAIEENVEESTPQVLPFARFLRVEKDEEGILEAKKERTPKDWLHDYELYDEKDDEIQSTYGTPNPNIPVSKTPCSGCGALLHCKETSIPGYIPSELFVGLSRNELTTIHCQRCHFLVNYNTAINVSVKPEDYIKIISTIKDKFALAVILVDLLDFPCSIFTGLSEILGPKRSVFIVGNKVDLLPKDHPNHLKYIKQCLKDEAMRMGFEERFIKHVALISAKTGFGVEELITRLHEIWRYRSDVYLIGCTNVGKSSLFNALLSSDYCKVEASNIIQKATTCPWPGTTLRMLKFPILKISDYRSYLRAERLKSERKFKYEEEKLRADQAKSTKQIKHATLIGHIGRSFLPEKEEQNDPIGQSQVSGFSGPILTLNEHSEKLKLSKWCYDTPGVVQKDQILNLLTTDEIIKTIPKEMIRARAFLLKPTLSLFLAGLGRLDYIDGPESTRVIVFSSLDLPVSIVETKDAEEFYDHFLGSEVLGVPMGPDEERLAKWPKLESSHDEIVIEGIEKHLTVCDILLSSAGWVGINLPKGVTAKFKAWTPAKRGIFVRNPSLLPYGMTLRGKRVRRSLAYLIGDAFTFKKPIKKKK